MEYILDKYGDLIISCICCIAVVGIFSYFFLTKDGTMQGIIGNYVKSICG